MAAQLDSITPSETGQTSADAQLDSDTTAASRQDNNEASAPVEQKHEFNKDYRFWMVMLTLVFSTLLVSLESTVVITSLPTIVADIGLGSDYIWVTNIFFLTSACVQPLFGQLSDLFGRKRVLLAVFAAYTLGSGIAGGASGSGMLIAGRAVMGVGSGGLNVAADVIISDLVPLRYRGNYIAVLLVVATVGFAVGPFLGGVIVERTTWRWVFYLNLPIGGIGMLTAHLFLHLRHNHTQSTASKLRRIDYLGNALLITSSISVLVALTWAGPVYPWSSPRVLTPFLLGIAGLFAFAAYEASPFPSNPVMPLRLFPHRTSRIVYVNTFLNSLLIMWCYYFLPLYFQAVRLSTPARSGVQMLPVALIAIPGAAVSAILLSRTGKFKVLHVLGFLLLTSGGGLLAVLDKGSPPAAWVLVQFLPAVGSGFLLNTLLPAFQASTAEADQAAATATWSFVRTFGFTWGVAIAGTVFNAYTKKYVYLIDDEAVRRHLSLGDAYASATRAFVEQFGQPVRDQIRHVFMLALRRVYLISVAFGGLAFVLSLWEKDVPLRQHLDTEYGMKEREVDKDKEEQ